jgi:hypothetical protein
MQLATDPARKLLAGMQANDLGSPVAADARQLAIESVTNDQAPTPLVLLDRAWETTDTRPWTGGPRQLHTLGV